MAIHRIELSSQEVHEIVRKHFEPVAKAENKLITNVVHEV